MMNRKKSVLLLVSGIALVLAVVYTCFYGGKREKAQDIETREISAAGSYVFQGDLSGKIKVEASPDDAVELVLNGVRMENPDGPCIKVVSAGTVTIVLREGTENLLVSGDPDHPSGTGSAVSSETDLILNGTGSLTVYGYNNNGIHSEGSIRIEDGTLVIYANGDGIEAEQDLTVENGEVTVTTLGIGKISDLSSILSGKGEFGFGGDPFGNGSGGMAPDFGTDPRSGAQPGQRPPSGGSFPDDFPGNMPGNQPDFGDNGMPFAFDGDFSGFDPGAFPTEDFTDPEDGTGRKSASDSQKGLKAGNHLLICGGTVTVMTADDSVHCNGELEISGGSLSLASGDDGIHADESIQISEGDIEILCSYEGIEAQHITVDGGTVSLVASDDGFNANGGSDSYGFGGFFGGRTSSDKQAGEDGSLPSLIFNGGTIQVDASGDGLDSNGDLILNGGIILVDGPSMSANGALDSGSENGGVLLVNGGTLLAIGASGMAESPESDSAQAFVYQNVNFNAGSEIRILDPDGNELLSHTAVRSGSNIVFSCPGLSVGDPVTILIDGSLTETTATKTSSGGFGMPGNNRDFGRGQNFGRPGR